MISYDAAFASSLSDVGGSHQNDRRTHSPIKHVIVVMGENRTFDHVFATYRPRDGEFVDNLLSKGIIDADGAPGPNYGRAKQFAAVDTGVFSISPGGKAPYGSAGAVLNPPSTSYAPPAPYTSIADAAVNGPGALTLPLAQLEAAGVLEPADVLALTTGTTGLAMGSADSRIKNYSSLPNGPYPLVTSTGASLYDTYGGSPVHRFYQMWQQLDCNENYASHRNPSGCLGDLFPWVEQTVSSGTNGKVVAPGGSNGHEGDIAMGFYNVAKGDAPYFNSLAHKYTLADNYHQPAMGGTFANQMFFGYAGALYYADAHGDPAVPNAVPNLATSPASVTTNEIENPDPQTGTNNVYTDDGYSGGSYTNCSDTTQPGVASVVRYLSAINVKPNCQPGAYYLLNNYVPAYTGAGALDPVNNGPYTLPPVVKQKHIGDALTQAQVSWAYFGQSWSDFKVAPGLGANPAIAPLAYLYCNICNPFLYSASVMTDAVARDQHNKDIGDFYNAIANDTLPAVSYVKSNTFFDGHPSSSKFSLFEDFSKKIVDAVQANPKLWAETAILITVDEGGGYYDSGYVQPVDFFGDGTRIPMIVVSPYSAGGRVAHEYGDHASIAKFIERNWGLSPLTKYSRDNYPNPVTSESNPYVPENRPAIGDLFGLFQFGDNDHDRDDRSRDRF